jgi:predicted MFS family arabinose efflux permease
VDLAGWQWVFLVNVPFVLVAAPLGRLWLPESHRPGTPPLDLGGAALSTLALTGIVFALIEGVDTGWTSPEVIVGAAVGVGAGVAFFAVELRQAHPLFDVRVLARARVAGGGLAILCAYIAMLGMLFLLPQYLQYVQDESPFASGAYLTSFGIGLGVFSGLSGRQVARFGSMAVLVTGLLTAAAGYVPLLFLSESSPPVLVTLGAGIVGCGMGLTFPPASTVVMNDLGVEKAGDGAAVNQLTRQIGGALGVAIVGSVFAAIYAARLPDEHPVARESIEDAADVAAGLPAVAGADLLEEAVASFDAAARWGLAVCMGVLLLAAARAAALGRTSEPEGRVADLG